MVAEGGFWRLTAKALAGKLSRTHQFADDLKSIRITQRTKDFFKLYVL